MVTVIPELEPHCGSWIVRKKAGAQIYELFDRANVEKAAAAGWEIWTALQWLAEFNRLGRQPGPKESPEPMRRPGAKVRGEDAGMAPP